MCGGGGGSLKWCGSGKGLGFVGLRSGLRWMESGERCGETE